MTPLDSYCVSLNKWKQHAESLSCGEKQRVTELCSLVSRFLEMECPNRASVQDVYCSTLLEIERLLQTIKIVPELDCTPLVGKLQSTHVIPSW
jgi:hypothetical protein